MSADRPPTSIKLLIEGKGGVHHIWGCDHYKTTLNALKFKQAYKKRTDLVKDAMSAVPYGDRAAMVNAIMDAIKKGGLFAVDVDIVPTKIGQACHVWLPAATSGEANLTSMNGERRMRLTERYMDPPGQAMPDCLIAARIANHDGTRVARAGQERSIADHFKGFDWKTEEDAFMDGYAQARERRRVRHLRLRAMGQRLSGACHGLEHGPVARELDRPPGEVLQGPQSRRAVRNRCRNVPTQTAPRIAPARAHHRHKRLYADGKFNPDGKATFMETQWRGLQAEGKEAEKNKWPFLINNGRTNHRLAERLSGPAQRIRDGSLALSRSSR